jgi:hypothetical protein
MPADLDALRALERAVEMYRNRRTTGGNVANLAQALDLPALIARAILRTVPAERRKARNGRA